MIVASDLTKKYGQENAVNRLNLEIPKGQFFGLLGPNGSGKTTTIHMLATLLSPTSGSVTINGVDISRNPQQVRRDIGLVFQESALDRMLSVEENLYFCAGLYDIKRKNIEDRINSLLDLFDLKAKRNAPVGSLSGGMRRAIDIIRGVLHSPSVLFLDEPTVGLDLPSRRRIWRFIQQLIEDQKLTVILTTHYLEEAAPCDKVAFIKKGSLVTSDSPQILVDKFGQLIIEATVHNSNLIMQDLGIPYSEYTNEGSTLLIRIGNQNNLSLDEIQNKLKTKAEKISIRKPNLNDVFLWLSGNEKGFD